MADKIKGFKAFGSDWKCNDFQFKVGDIFKTDDVKMCEKGFYFCENGIDVFSYYNPASSKFAEVEGSGKIEKHDDDSKVACSEIHCSEIHIKAEVSLNALIGAGVKFILDKVDWTKKKESNTGYHSAATNTGYRSAATNTGDHSAATNTGDQSAATNTGDQSAATNTGHRSTATNTGDQSAATNTGDQSAATNTGDQSAATNTGDRSAASVEGKQSIACGLGIENKVKGSLGCWLVLTKREEKNYEWVINSVKSAKVDGKKIKADTWYILKAGKFVEC